MPYAINNIEEPLFSIKSLSLLEIEEWIYRELNSNPVRDKFTQDLSKVLVIIDFEGLMIDARDNRHSILHTYNKKINDILQRPLHAEELSLLRTLLVYCNDQQIINNIRSFVENLNLFGAQIIGISSLLTGNIPKEIKFARANLNQTTNFISNDVENTAEDGKQKATEDVNFPEYLSASAKIMGLKLSDCGHERTLQILGVAPYFGHYPVFNNGILFTNGEFDHHGMPTHGRALAMFLRTSKRIHDMQHIVYISDNKTNISLVAAAVLSQRFYRKLHFMYYDKCNNQKLELNNKPTIEQWRKLLRYIPQILTSRNKLPLDMYHADYARHSDANYKSKTTFLSTGLYSGVSQFNLKPISTTSARKNIGMEQLWIFRGALDVTVFRKGIYPNKLSIKNPQDYQVVKIPDGVSYKLQNSSGNPASILIASIPSSPIMPVIQHVKDFESIATAEAPSPQITKPKPKSPGEGVEVQDLAYAKNTILKQYTMQRHTSTGKLIDLIPDTPKERIVIINGFQAMDLIRMRPSEDKTRERVEWLCSATSDQYATANIPIGVNYEFRSRSKVPITFLVLETQRPNGAPRLLG